MEYNVYMTNDCNLNCAYCSVLLDCEKNGIPIHPTYEVEKLAAYIDKTQQKYNDNEVVIFFFGGEPSMEYDRIRKYMECFDKTLRPKYDLKYILHTNGLLLNEIPDDVLAKLDLSMYSLNYEMFPHVGLADSYFQRVMDNALEAKEKKPSFEIVARLTITEKTSFFNEIMQVYPFFDMVYWQLENTPAWKDPEYFIKTYNYEVSLVFRHWLKELKAGRMLKFIPFMAVLKFMFFHDRDDNEFLCGYDTHMLYVQTNGKCYACCDAMESPTHYVGDIEKGSEFRGLKLSDFVCKDCDYRRICMGRCGRMHREFTPEHIDHYCRMNKHTFDLFIERKDELAQILKEHPEYEAMLSGWDLDIMEYTS